MPATLKDQLEAATLAMDAKVRPPGGEWWQLSTAEQDVFAIDRARFPRMIMTHHCYEAFNGMADSPEWDAALAELTRRERPEWCGTPPTVEEFQQFGEVFGGLTLREGFAIFYKTVFWMQRIGVADFGNEQDG